MTRQRTFPVRVAVVSSVIALLMLLFIVVDLQPDLSHMNNAMLAGPARGNYTAIGERLAASATAQKGKLSLAVSDGTVDNLEQLVAARDNCRTQFGLVQNGVPGPQAAAIELLGRLPKSESIFFIGKNADELKQFEQLRDLRIGVGPAKSGTNQVARQILESVDFAALNMKLSNHTLTEQLERLERNELDLGVFVLDEDASLITQAIRERKLQLADFKHLDIIARQYPFLWHGRIGTGQYDPIALQPPSDRRVLRVDTLVVGNGCASHAQNVALLSLLSENFPRFIGHNRQHSNSTAFALSGSAKAFFTNEGPEFADRYAPWLVNVMPPSNWVYVVMSISILFNIMGFGHRFRLWRIDAGRVKIEQDIRDFLGQSLTPEEIARLEPDATKHQEELLPRIDQTLSDLNELRSRIRSQAVSMLVPMGQEMAYRYQEDQIEQAVSALRNFRSRLVEQQQQHA